MPRRKNPLRTLEDTEKNSPRFPTEHRSKGFHDEPIRGGRGRYSPRFRRAPKQTFRRRTNPRRTREDAEKNSPRFPQNTEAKASTTNQPREDAGGHGEHFSAIQQSIEASAPTANQSAEDAGEPGEELSRDSAEDRRHDGPCATTSTEHAEEPRTRGHPEVAETTDEQPPIDS